MKCREYDRGSSLIVLNVHCNVYKYGQNYIPWCVFFFFWIWWCHFLSIYYWALYNREGATAGVVLSYATSIFMYLNVSRHIFYYSYSEVVLNISMLFSVIWLYIRDTSITGVVLSCSTSISMNPNTSRSIFYHVYFSAFF